VQLVGNTRFATILPRIVVERAVRAGTLRAYPILAPRIVRHIICITHPRRPLSAAAEALISIIADELRKVLNAAPLDATKDTPTPIRKI
jgi:LysR family nitrogen assimilation transcriptional regulator